MSYADSGGLPPDGDEVLVFDNLYRPTEIVGDYKTIKARKPECFVSPNASGSLPDICGLEKIGTIGKQCGLALRNQLSN